MGQLVTVDGTVVPTAEEALVFTHVATVRRVLARLGLEERALTLLFILTGGEDTSDTWIKGTFACTPHDHHPCHDPYQPCHAPYAPGNENVRTRPAVDP